ncbi:MAG: hypothetical protein FJZ92_13235 [Chloroflexi bacterium]|nr:hypothetical protein [Chloroflexota bacterium]
MQDDGGEGSGGDRIEAEQRRRCGTAPRTKEQLERLDLRREWKALYPARRSPALLDVPARTVLVIEDTGPPMGRGDVPGALRGRLHAEVPGARRARRTTRCFPALGPFVVDERWR